MEILFEEKGSPYSSHGIEACVTEFGKGYNRTVSKVIANSNGGLDKNVFRANVGMLMPNFLMGRAGPSKGLSTRMAVLLTQMGLFLIAGKVSACQQLRSEILLIAGIKANDQELY